MTRHWRSGRGFDPHQFQIEWSGKETSPPEPKARTEEPAIPPPSVPVNGLTLKLKWDFKTSFPEPTEQAVEAGTISAEDMHPAGIRGIHEEQAREMLVTLHDLDAVLDARRRGVDPRNNKAPMLKEARERLRKFFDSEPARLENWYSNLLGVYADAFGQEAADAFDKAVRAWHAGIEVVADSISTVPRVLEVTPPAPAPTRLARPRNPGRISARLPVPRPLLSAIVAGHFGKEEDGKPVRPCTHEVRAITEQHAENLIGLLDTLASSPAKEKHALRSQFDTGITAYAEDFGQHAAEQLEAYVRRHVGLDSSDRGCRR